MASTRSLPPTMVAWTHMSRGPPSRVLHLTSDVPIRQPKKPSELLIKISHAALNPGGSIMMHFVPFLFRHAPAIPEMDFSGTIVSTGPEPSESDSLLAQRESMGLVVGAQVFGSILVPEHLGAGRGTLAEYVIAEAANVVKKPGNATMEEIAGLGVAGSTALVLVEKAGLKNGDSVLVNGASGGIGSMVVQLVKEIVGKSGRVVGVCSGRNAEVVKGLGADEVIDYEAHAPVTEYLAEQYGESKFNVVIDALGIQEIWTHSAEYLVEQGPFVTAGVALKEYTFSQMMHTGWLMMLKNSFLPVWLGGVPRKYVRVMGLVNSSRLHELGRLVEEGKLKGVIDSCWEMEDAQQAYKKMLSKRARGKVIVKVDSS